MDEALDEVYNMYMLLHRSDLKSSARFRQFVPKLFLIFRSRDFSSFSNMFSPMLMKFHPNFTFC